MSWPSHVLPLIDAYEEIVPHRASFSNPDRSRKLKQWLVGFVDNNTIIFTIKGPHFDASNIQRLFKWQMKVFLPGKN